MPTLTGGSHTGVEEIGLEEDLPVGDRDDVGRDVGRDVAFLRLDDRQRGHRPTAERIRELRRALEQPRVQVEHVARERLTARRTTQQQHDLPIRERLLVEVVVEDHDVATLVAQPLAHRGAGITRQVLHRRGSRSRRRHDDRVRHRALLLELGHDRLDGRLLLADRDVDADDLILVVRVAATGRLLVEDRVDADRGLAGRAVADDQLTLAAADRDHRVDRLDAGLQRLLDGLPLRHRRRAAFDRTLVRLGRLDRPLAVDGVAQRVDDAPDECHAGRDRDHAPGRLDRVAFLDLGLVAEDDGADVVLLEVQCDARGATRKLEQLVHHALVEAVDARDAVTDLEDRADVRLLHLALEAFDLLLQDARDFGRFEIHRLIRSCWG